MDDNIKVLCSGCKVIHEDSPTITHEVKQFITAKGGEFCSYEFAAKTGMVQMIETTEGEFLDIEYVRPV